MDNKVSKLVWLALPTSLLPYAVIVILSLVFFYRGNNMTVFLPYLILGLFLLCILAIAQIAVYCSLAIRKRLDALSLAKLAMIIKLIQVPAYLLIFVVGFLMLLTIWTYAITVLLFLLDCLTLVLSGLMTTVSVINANRQGIYPIKQSIWCIILQFVFCADVVATVIYYKKLQDRQLSTIDA